MKNQVSFELEFKKHKLPGMLIAIEGIDGSGKTTQAHTLVQKLIETGKEAVYTKEPTDGEIGRFIREILSGKKKFEPVAFQYLFAADRVEHQNDVLELLLRGKTVVSDRWFWSSVAYGAADRGIDTLQNNEREILLTTFGILSMYHQFIVPDVTIFLDVAPETALKRLSAARHVADIYDKVEKLEKVKQGYEWLCAKFPEEFVIVNGEINADEVTSKILQEINNK